ncbi:hypothetical protein QQS21_011121 [Conoideocrella luteorostrata]|uniref:DUF2235 domain-containing protein n=1 Tax=Conoideocrella luteorostrata TaxID=1105319 RepID=A0AAJ0CGF4_9HYPO|nr:hypothetical protein QQS21_011121 [Conoideocrella luteorostrata]
MNDKTSRTRVVACIDGTWFDDDGQCGNGNASSIHRLARSTKKGIIKNDDGSVVKQIVKYFSGTGLQKPARHKVNDDVSAEGYKDQVQAVYSFCHDNVESSDDEVWLFGFSRGAYVARVVALFLENPLLYDRFEVPVERGWRSRIKGFRPKSLRTIQDLRAGPWEAGGDSKCVCVHFLGLFDTIMPTNAGLDVAAESPAMHTRHALGLNEKRKSHSPLRFKFAPGDSASSNKDWVEAWFAGAHTDIGGGELHDGLSLYPLQWMLVEAKTHGLELTNNSSFDLLRPAQNKSPLDMVFPLPEPHPTLAQDGSIVPEQSNHPEPWAFIYGNDIKITMYDIRSTHNHGENKKPPPLRIQNRRGPPAAKHFVRLNEKPGHTSGTRQVFEGDQFGRLLGYSSTSSSGAIIHPSVYFLLDSHAHLKLRRGLKDVQHHLLKFRQNAALHYVQDSIDPWIRHEFQATVGCCRILVCGNTGVGKSTLLNCVFGMPLARESSSRCIKQNINQEFETEMHPGIILHDSEGFQSGAVNEVMAFKQFLKKRSSNRDHSQQLHAIWLCILTEEVRPVQVALSNVLEKVAEMAAHIPIVIVGTKKDRYCRAEQEAEETVLPRREELFKHEFEHHSDTRHFWSKLNVQYTFVSYDDPKSIQRLIHLTMASLDSSAELGLVAAQVQDIDVKIEQAVDKTFEVLRSTMITATVGLGSGMVSIASTPTLSRVLCHKIAYGCFGIPKEFLEGISTTLNRIVWANLAGFMTRGLVQIGSLGLGVKMLKGVALLDAPAAARMLVKCACDLILILDQAFRDGGKSLNLDKIGDVSTMYARSSIKDGPAVGKSRRKAVHEDVNNTFTLSSRGQSATYRLDPKYRMGVEAIIKRWRWKDDGGTWNKTETATVKNINGKKVVSGSPKEEDDPDLLDRPEQPPRKPMPGSAPKPIGRRGSRKAPAPIKPRTNITADPKDKRAKPERPGSATGQGRTSTSNQAGRGRRQQPSGRKRVVRRPTEPRDEAGTNDQTTPSDILVGLNVVADLGGTGYDIFSSVNTKEPPALNETNTAEPSTEDKASGSDDIWKNGAPDTQTIVPTVPAEPDAVEAGQCPGVDETLGQDKTCDETEESGSLRETEGEEDAEDSDFEDEMATASQYTEDGEYLDPDEQTEMASEGSEDDEDLRRINADFEEDIYDDCD